MYGSINETEPEETKTDLKESPPNVKMNKRLENACKLIRAQIHHKHPFLFRQESSQLASIKGGATLTQAESEAVKQGIIKKHSLSKAKTDIGLWEITEIGYQLLNETPKHWKSKGGYLHKFCAYRIAENFEDLGYKASIEYQHSNGKLIDICLKKENEIIFVEICASYPLEKELVNLKKNLDGTNQPDKLIFSVTKRKMKKELEELIASVGQLPCQVEVVLAGNLTKMKEII